MDKVTLSEYRITSTLMAIFVSMYPAMILDMILNNMPTDYQDPLYVFYVGECRRLLAVEDRPLSASEEMILRQYMNYLVGTFNQYGEDTLQLAQELLTAVDAEVNPPETPSV